MDKKSKFALYAIGFVILLMMIAEVTKPKALNWRDSYSAADKIPLGCYVIYNELKDYSDKEILTSTETLYEYLKTVSDSTKTTLILINNYININGEESKSLAKYVEDGNSVFLSGNYIYGNIMDSLNISMQREYSNLFKKPTLSSFTSPSLKENERLFEDVIENSYFTSIDTLKTVVLGNMTYETKDEDEDEPETNPNFIKVNYGEQGGAFYIHSNPFAFTNYHMLNDKENYVASVLSYLPKHQIIWDNYKKSGRKIITSPLRFILTNKALKWAFYGILLSLFLFVLFKGKRIQRIIPVVEPLKNTSVEFTQTIGSLYYQHGDFKNIINKKIVFFLEFIRTKYFLNTSELNERFIEKLAIKSNITKANTKETIDYLVYLKSKSYNTENELITLNKKLEQFTKNNS